MFRLRTARILVVGCLKYTQGLNIAGTKDGSHEEGCCDDCNEDRSGGLLSRTAANYYGHHSSQPRWTEQLVMTGFSSNASHPYRLSLNEDVARCNNKQGTEDPPVEGHTDGDPPKRLKRFDWREHGAEHGVTTEKLYPFTSGNKRLKEYESVEKRYKRCKKVDPNSLAFITGYEYVKPNGDDLEAALLINPVVVTIAVNDYFERYSAGIITLKDCPTLTDDELKDPNFIPHSVLIIGFDETDWGCRYWIGKNSWGERWGEGGFFRLERDVRDPWGVCAVTSLPGMYPTGFHYRPVLPRPPASRFSSISNFSLWSTSKSGLGVKDNPCKSNIPPAPSSGKQNEMSLYTVNTMQKVDFQNPDDQTAVTNAISLRQSNFHTLVASLCSTAESYSMDHYQHLTRNVLCSTSAKYSHPQLMRNGLAIALEA
ncbi:hypothetical protein ACQ4PT_030411 [Festuca glaucescens]